MKFYLLLDGDIIRDAITYQYDGYTEVEFDTMHLPVGINAGYYRLQDGVPVLDTALRDEVLSANIPEDYAELKTRLSAAEEETAALNLAIIDLWETIANGGAA